MQRVIRMTDMPTKRLVANHLAVPMPIVAAVQGYAIGMGANLALFCDVVFAAEDAVFADNHVAVGLVAGDGGTVMWPMLMPMNTAKYYLLHRRPDRRRDRQSARARVRRAPGPELDDRARALAHRLAGGASFAIKATKRSLNTVIRDRVGLLLDNAIMSEGLSFLSLDHQEAAQAFVEKRQPKFVGH